MTVLSQPQRQWLPYDKRERQRQGVVCRLRVIWQRAGMCLVSRAAASELVRQVNPKARPHMGAARLAIAGVVRYRTPASRSILSTA